MSRLRYETPAAVAKKLASNAPASIRRLLDPSFGGGALILPLAKKLNRCKTTVYCVDNDPAAVSDMAANLPTTSGISPNFITDDFLNWVKEKRRNKFDCIVMNPPFSAVQSQLVKQSVPTFPKDGGAIVRSMPIEAAFLFHAIELLEDGGRLLAVLPTSVVMSESLQWLRLRMFALGAVRSVHELPPSTFANVESRMYLLVFDKGGKQRKLRLYNHDLEEPHELKLSMSSGDAPHRLDYGFNHAKQTHSRVLNGSCSLEWKPLGELVEIHRGKSSSPFQASDVVHSCDYRDGYWHRPSNYEPTSFPETTEAIRRTDILLQRCGEFRHEAGGAAEVEVRV